jgi:hypothetical protein
MMMMKFKNQTKSFFKKFIALTMSLILALFWFSTNAQNIDTSLNRVNTGIEIPLKCIGSVKYKSTDQIQSSNWLLGCETLDRDYANYDEYKSYIALLGIKRLRLQGGWDKTEKIKGQYDWAWMDHIINDAVDRGFVPWFQLSYGNHNYEGGGGSNLGAGVPHSKVALAAWDKWVAAVVSRYKDKVKNWEIWNEPNFGDNLDNTPEKAAELNIRTIDIIKKIQPDAIVSGMALGHISLPYADEFFKILAKKNKLDCFDNMTYHDYVYNPDSHYGQVKQLRAILEKYTKKVKLRQGENGAPSEPNLGGALGNYEWSELSQAKWVTRRMLGDLGHDIESSVFTIVEIAYAGSGPITKLNVKGLLKSDSTKKVRRPKISYYAVQNVTSIFDNSLERLTNLHPTFNTKDLPQNQVLYSTGTDRSYAVYGYQNKKSKQQIFTIWSDEAIPTNTVNLKTINFTVLNGKMDHPVFVDIITGKVYEIPESNFTRKDGKLIFKNLPVYDSPIIVADKSLINIY